MVGSMGESSDSDKSSGKSLDAEYFDMVYWCRVVGHIADQMRLEVVRTGRVESAYDYNFGFFLETARADQKLFESIPSFRVPAVAADLGEILAFIFRFQFFTDFRGALCTAIERFVMEWPTAFGPLASGAFGVSFPVVEDSKSEILGGRETAGDIDEFLEFLSEVKGGQSAED